MTGRIAVLTIFPELFDSFVGTGLVGKAIARGLVAVDLVDIRDFTKDVHRTVDDTPYGGGAGMLMKAPSVVEAMEAAGEGRRIVLRPQGARFDQAAARRLAGEERLVLVCGRYEGFDERVLAFADEELSIGDFVLHGGEVAAMAVIEAVVRLRPEFMGNSESLGEESFTAGLLEYPQYTRPPAFRGLEVPQVLVSGNHEKIRRWRRGESLIRTRRNRPDLFAALRLDGADEALLEEAQARGAGEGEGRVAVGSMRGRGAPGEGGGGEGPA